MWKKVKQVLNLLLNIALAGFALIALWLLSLVFVYSTFNIPTKSMMPALHPKDRVIVWKMEAGARLFSLQDAFGHKPLKVYRLPGFSAIKRNDILVFNFPYPERWDSIGFDVKLYYAKRCVALPGDSFEIRSGIFHVRNNNLSLGCLEKQQEVGRLSLPKDGTIPLREITGFEAYPFDSAFQWSIADFGPLYIPKAGDSVTLTHEHYLLYRNLISWETRLKVTEKQGVTSIGGKPASIYTFTHDYYFVAGDDCMDSRDSRYWGLLPDDYIVGIAHKMNF